MPRKETHKAFLLRRSPPASPSPGKVHPDLHGNLPAFLPPSRVPVYPTLCSPSLSLSVYTGFPVAAMAGLDTPPGI